MSNVNIWLWVLALIIAYLLGNISPSTLLAKAKISTKKEAVMRVRPMLCVSWARKPASSLW